MTNGKRAKAAVISDFLELGANAFVGGVMVAIALAAITLALASTVRAGDLDDAATVLSANSAGGPADSRPAAQETRSVAPAGDGSSTVAAGALWDTKR